MDKITILEEKTSNEADTRVSYSRGCTFSHSRHDSNYLYCFVNEVASTHECFSLFFLVIVFISDKKSKPLLRMF